MYLERKIDEELSLWKKANNRKPLVLRGARQVGKSTAVKHLATQFKYFVEINFDENPSYASAFENGLNVIQICEQLSVLTNTHIIAGETLLFLDEIQACVPAISSLRYFYEKMPQLHLIAAGSLLEFALAEIPSFGVGRVRFMFIYPFSFEEFLMANKETGLLHILKETNTKNPLITAVHLKLNQYLKKFLIIGGMPEAVQVYLTSGSMIEVQRVLDDLILTIQADFVKYKTRITAISINQVFNAVIQQIGHKFSYTYPNSTLNNVQIKDALTLLQMAGLLYPVTHTASNGIPLSAEINIKKRKILILDTGVFQRILGLNIATLLIENDFEVINKGNIAELFVGLELLKNASCYQKTELFYWHREVKNSQAEVDFVIQKQDKIIPIEVKAGTKGTMQSLYLFLTEKKLAFGIRLSLENFGEIEKVKIYPLYAVMNLFLDEKNEQF